MAEAQKGFATLDDVDTGTFVRFIEWAHRGYYTAAEFTTVEYESPCPSVSPNDTQAIPAAQAGFDFEESLPPVLVSWPQSVPSYERGKKSKRFKRASLDTAPKTKEELKEAFISRRYTLRLGASENPPPRPNQCPEEDYTDVFLSHVQLYVFADKYDIEKLKVLALEELHATLAIYTLHLARTGDIVTLLRYVYRNTGQSDGSEEDLRQMLKTYIGYEMDTLINDGDFRDLMIEDGGPLLGDFITMVGRRISVSV